MSDALYRQLHQIAADRYRHRALPYADPTGDEAAHRVDAQRDAEAGIPADYAATIAARHTYRQSNGDVAGLIRRMAPLIARSTP